MPTGRTTIAYTPSEEELAALEAELAAQEAVPSPGLGGGSFEAVPAPPPQQAAPPQPTYSVTDAGTYSGAGAGYPPPQAPPTAPVPPPPPPSSGPTLDFLMPAAQARDAIGATGFGRAIGGVLSTPLPGTESLPPPPTAVGGQLAQGDPGGAAQLVGDVAGADPLTTVSLLLGGPLVGGLGRGAIGVGRGVLAGGAARTAALKTARDAAALAGAASPFAGAAWLFKDLGSEPSPAASTTRSSATPTATSTPTSATPASTSSTARRPASSAPASAPVSATNLTTQTGPASAPARSSSPSSGDTDDDLLATLGLIDDPVDVASEAPFSASDFAGDLGLPQLRSIDQNMATRMATIANGKLRRRRRSRRGPFTMERGDLHRIISESVHAALEGKRS